MFWGRERELGRLHDELDAVVQSGQGRMLALRGRRQSGKSRLLAEFVERAGLPYLFTTAVKNAPPDVQLQTVADDLHTARTPLPALDTAFAANPTSWADLFARLPLAFDGQPGVVVLDEFPWAVETDDTLEGTLQAAWDRTFEQLPVLWVVIGSDVAMMERLTEHDRPLYGRTREMVVAPLSPAEVAAAVGDRDPVDVIDVYLATGGYPRLVSAAAEHPDAATFVHAQLSDDTSPLMVTGQRVLSSEFRDAESVRTVLEAIGSVEVGHATFSSAVGVLGGEEKAAGAAVARALEPLQAKRLVTIDMPVGAGPRSKLRRYRIVDPYLRFFFRFCQPELAHVEQGRADLARSRFNRDYSSWRGRAVEPVVHAAVARLAAGGDGRFADVEQVGSWWDRSKDHEFDLVGADRARKATWVGSVKWRSGRPMNRRYLGTLAAARAVVPGAQEARLLAVCPAGVDVGAGFDGVLVAGDIVDAFAV